MTEKRCVVCNKLFTPNMRAINRQLCCSAACRKERNKILNRDRRRANKDIIAAKYRALHPSKCKICGKPTSRNTETNYTRSLHEKCVTDNIADTLILGEKLTNVQQSRLRSRGYTKADFDVLIANRLDELTELITDDEREELKAVINYILDNHTNDEAYKIKISIRHIVGLLLQPYRKENTENGKS